MQPNWTPSTGPKLTGTLLPPFLKAEITGLLNYHCSRLAHLRTWLLCSATSGLSAEL